MRLGWSDGGTGKHEHAIPTRENNHTPPVGMTGGREKPDYSVDVINLSYTILDCGL